METTALFLGERWLPYREAGEKRRCSVHSVFDRVVNVSTGEGLLSVASGGVGGSSAFLTVPGSRLHWGAVPGERGVVGGGLLCFDGQTVVFGKSALWKGPISREYRRGGIKQENIAAFKAALDRKAAPGSAGRHVNGGEASRFSGLAAIRKLREDPSLARKLVGLGPGLTPSGDDMLIGFLAMVNHDEETWPRIGALREAVADSLRGTTDISAQALKNALDCDYHEFAQNCVRDLREGGPEAVYLSAVSLLGVGATSGADIACGMYFGMNINER